MSIFSLKGIFETVFPKRMYVSDDCRADGTPYEEMVYAVADKTSYNPHWINYHLEKLLEIKGDLSDLTVAEAVRYVRSLPNEPFPDLPQGQQQESIIMAGCVDTGKVLIPTVQSACNFV